MLSGHGRSNQPLQHKALPDDHSSHSIKEPRPVVFQTIAIGTIRDGSKRNSFSNPPTTTLDLRIKESSSKNAESCPTATSLPQQTLGRKRPRPNYYIPPIDDFPLDDDEFRVSDSTSCPRKRSRNSSKSSSASSRKEPIPPHLPTKSVKRPSPPSRQSSDLSKQYLSAVLVNGKARPPPTPSEIQRRNDFLRNLNVLQGVTLVNTIDNETPSTTFRFITESILGTGVHRATEEVMLGCTCQKKYKQQYGCVYLNYCTCIQDSGVDSTGKKYFAYGASDKNYRCLRPQALNSRDHIYECNTRCDCTQNCKNRVVQHGRQVKIEIFKTIDRGWGLRCNQDLKKGQFIDTYRGEIITSEESDRRGKLIPPDQANFLFDLDKFEKIGDYDYSRQYVCDGMFMGSPTRFINHSCDPNCGMYTVSYNHNDRNIYELAFFAREVIPKGTELTFDYHDDEETHIISDALADEDEKLKGYRPTRCLCGAEDCRRYFFN